MAKVELRPSRRGLAKDQKETVASQSRPAKPKTKTRLRHFLLHRLRRYLPTMACLPPGQRLLGPAVQDINTSCRHKLLMKLGKQSLAVKKQVVAVHKENYIDRFIRQIGITVLREHRRQGKAGRNERSFIFLRRPFLQNNIQPFAAGILRILRTPKDKGKGVIFMPKLLGAGEKSKALLPCLSNHRCLGNPMVLFFTHMPWNPISQRAAPLVNDYEIAARLQRSPYPAQHLSGLGKMVVNTAHVG